MSRSIEVSPVSDGCRNFDLEDVNVEGAERIAEVVAKYDIDRFIHVSSYNADKNSPSAFFRTKARGEEVVRSIFPETTIVRPAPVFGFEDKLLHKLAGQASLFTSNHMRERFWPVHVSCSVSRRSRMPADFRTQCIDIGSALSVMAEDDSTAAETYELYGPKQYSMAELAALVDREIVKHRRHINLPPRLLKGLADMYNRFIWWSQTSADSVEREFIDQKIDPKAKTFKDLGIEPAEIANYTFHYLVSVDFSGHVAFADGVDSKVTGVRLSTIFPQRQSEKSARRKSTYMLLTINEHGRVLLTASTGVKGAGKHIECEYLTDLCWHVLLHCFTCFDSIAVYGQ